MTATTTVAATPPHTTIHTALSTEHHRPDETTQWTRLRWAVRLTPILGVAASVAANILHARTNPVSQAIAAWPPVALLLTVELISRVPVHRSSLAVVRILATATIAAIAAWVSYWHMAGVAARYGETGASAYLLPLSVDGLVIAASISLVELSSRNHTTTGNAAIPPPRQGSPSTLAAVAPPVTTPRKAPTTTGASRRLPKRSPRSQYLQAASSEVLPDASASAGRGAATVNAPHNGHDVPMRTAVGPGASQVVTAATDGASTGAPDDGTAVPTQTAAAVAYWLRQDPSLGPDDIAARVGRSSRQVRRHLQRLTHNET
jgi:hypothetical protein